MERFFNRYLDIGLAAAVVGIVAMLIVPLPTFLIDILLASNIGFAVVLLLSATYIASALRITALPAILLLSTLYRLALNVSTTRLILLNADAGRVVEAFGTFVVRGSYIVGAVVFLILTIVQFVVIARGSERVAEVAARFTLDAMPGRQMAIDADLRSGAIDLAGARTQRASLQRESRLYGAMDGAMKFVKGDAIAGIIIIAINIVAGLAIGVLQHGMPVGEAAKLYTLLTIGDGLVSQIPAVLIATAAGVVITRVEGERPSTHLGREIGAQLLQNPRAVAVTAGLLLAFALLPGMPLLPFLLLAVFLALVARGLRWRRRHAGDTASFAEHPRATAPGPSPRPLVARLGPALWPSRDLVADGRSDPLGALARAAERLGRDRGVPVSRPVVERDPDLRDDRAYRFDLDDIPFASGRLPGDRLPVEAPPDGLPIPELAEAAEADPNLAGIYWLPMAAGPALEHPSIRPLSLLQVVGRHLEDALGDQVHELLGIEETQRLVDQLASSHPKLVQAVVPRVVGITELADVLRRLLEERLSIRNLRRILETIAICARPDPPPAAVLTERVRAGLRREITHRFAGQDGELSALLLDRSVEDMIRSGVEASEQGPLLSLEPTICHELADAIAEAAHRDSDDAGPPPLLLTHPELRPHLRKLAALRLPDAVVLSFAELLPEVKVRALGRVRVGSADSET